MIEEEEDANQKQVDKVINKWFSLQKIIKEGITLNQMIDNQEKENNKTLTNKFSDYYKNKLIVREIFEKTQLHINNIYHDFKPFELIGEKRDAILSDAFIPTDKLFGLLRNDFRFIVNIASVMEQRIEDPNIDSIVYLFCHQLYENILIPNPEHEELLILCSLLLEQEIKRMTTLSISSFIDENYTFLGKFLKSFTKKPELITYLSMTLGKIIAGVDNNEEFFMDLNPYKILSKEIYSSGSHYNNEKLRKLLENYYLKENDAPSTYTPQNQNMDNTMNEKDDDVLDLMMPIITRKRSTSKEIINIKEFNDKITQKNLIERIITEKDENIKEFYKRQIERLCKDKNIYTCDQFLESLYHLKTKDSILKHYVSNFEIIKILIDKIIQSLISSVSTIPYSLRCICKIICILIQKRFPHIGTYERNAFIGEFIFGKCILPILIDCEHNGVITSSILSSNVRECLKIVSKVLIKISRGLLFDSTIDMNYTIFNHYIIEIIPEINHFCNELIKVKLPSVVDDLVNGKLTEPMIKYDYFKVNKEELINMQCVCLSIEDLLTLINHIEPVIYLFKPADTTVKSDEQLFYITMQKLIGRKTYLVNQMNKTKTRQFFLIFREEKNPNVSAFKGLSQEKLTFCTDQNTSSVLILPKIKYSIELILQELNLLNNKVYSFLNQAKTNEKFFFALNQTLKVEEHNIELDTEKILLNWYSLYLISNLKKLDRKYQMNDFKALYEELFKEESNMIHLLKQKSNVIITKYGMNLRCAESILQKARSDQSRAVKIIRIIKTKKLIENEVLSVCVTSINEMNNFTRTNTIQPLFRTTTSNRKLTKNQKPMTNRSITLTEDNYALTSIIVIPTECCCHDERVEHLTKSSGPHVKNIKNFIKKIVQFQEIRDDIVQGKHINNIAKSITNFLIILQKKIEIHPMFRNDNEPDSNNKGDNDKRNMEEQSIDKKKNVINDSKEIEDIIEKVRYFIYKRIYLKVYPEQESQQDIKFYRQTLMLSWITPDHLEIKKIFINENVWESAISSINKMDEVRTPQDKITLLHNAYRLIDSSIKFCSGKKDAFGAEELTPIFQFIVIKAQSKRLFSNINYIKGLCDSENEQDVNKANREFYLQHIEAAVIFIMNLTYNQLKITKEDFDKNIDEKMQEYSHLFNDENSNSFNSLNTVSYSINKPTTSNKH